MKITQKELKKSKIQLTIVVEEKDLAHARKRAIQEISEQVKIPGFRAGHIPEDTLLQHVGEEMIRGETQKTAITECYQRSFEEVKLHPISQPKLEIVKDEPLTFTLTFDVLPEIKMGKYRDVKVTVKEKKVTEKEIKEIIEKLQEQVPSFKDVQRKAKKDDMLEFDFEGFTLDGLPVPNTKAEKYKLLLGSSQFIPGFEDNLMGISIGEEKSFDITFPKDYHAKEMAGVKYKFKVKAHSIQEKALPEVNEEFVEKITGKKGSVDSLKEEIKKNLEMKKSQEARAKAEEELLEKLAKTADFEVPEILVAEEQEFIIDNIKMGGLERGLPWEKYLEAIKKTEDELKKEVLEDAVKRVKFRLIIQEIIKLDKITADEADVQGRAAHTFSHLKPEQQKSLKDSYQKGGRHYEQIRSAVLVENLFDSFLGKPHLEVGHVHDEHCHH